MQIGHFGAISKTEASFAAPIPKAERHILDRSDLVPFFNWCSVHTCSDRRGSKEVGARTETH